MITIFLLVVICIPLAYYINTKIEWGFAYKKPEEVNRELKEVWSMLEELPSHLQTLSRRDLASLNVEEAVFERLSSNLRKAEAVKRKNSFEAWKLIRRTKIEIKQLISKIRFKKDPLYQVNDRRK